MNRSVMSNDYWVKIWRSRFFWIHLVFSDLRSRWRRSFFGMAWAIIQPLGLTLLMSFVFSKLFHSDIGTYAPYIFSGVIIWDYILTSVTGGALSFVQAEAYIKQCRHPLAIYTLRTVLVGLMDPCLRYHCTLRLGRRGFSRAYRVALVGRFEYFPYPRINYLAICNIAVLYWCSFSGFTPCDGSYHASFVVHVARLFSS